MVTTDKKIEVLCKEKDDHRNEISEMNKVLNNDFWLFLSVSASIITLFWNDDGKMWPNITISRKAIIIVLTQVEFVLYLHTMISWILQRINSGYIAALEEKINDMCVEKLVFWESEMAQTFVANTKSSLFWAAVVMHSILLLTFIGTSILASRIIEGIMMRLYYIELCIAEGLFAIYLLIKSFTEVKKTKKTANAVLGL
jgi:hypothetical protein